MTLHYSWAEEEISFTRIKEGGMDLAVIAATTAVIGGCVAWLASAVITDQLEEDYFYASAMVIVLALTAFVVCLRG